MILAETVTHREQGLSYFFNAAQTMLAKYRSVVCGEEVKQMTRREMNELFFQAWADDKGVIQGEPVGLIYKMNQMLDGYDDTVDEALLALELKLRGLRLP